MSTSPSRDTVDADVERLLRAALKPSAGGRAGECPDAESLAAFVEGRLPPRERAPLDAHFAACGRCQETLAVMGAAPPLPLVAPVRPGWFARITAPRLRWLVPVSAAAAVAAVFFATRPVIAPGEHAATAEAPVQMAHAAPPELGPAGAARNEVPEAALQRDASARTGAAADELKPGGPRRPAAVLADEGAAGEGGRQAVSLGMPTAEQAVPAAAAMRETRDVREVAVSEGAKPAGLAKSATQSEAAGAPLAASVAFRERDAAGALLPVVAAPDGVVQWKLGAEGRVWRSEDGGVRWREQRTGVGAVLTAGSAMSADVCWIVGEGGTVLLTVDGAFWQQRPFPFLADLVDVRAASARSAVVTARDGRRFETRDGGLTWR